MDPELPPFAAARAAKLMMEMAGGVASDDVRDKYPAPVSRPRITLRPARTDALLGIRVGQERQAQLLRSIEFEVIPQSNGLDVQPPSFRPDVRREVDLIEEVARLEGLERLPSTLPRGRIGGLNKSQTDERTIRRTLAALGLKEVWTTSFMAPRDLDALKLYDGDPMRHTVEVSNPMSEEEKLLRTTLLPGLLRAARHNLARSSAGAALFEVARIYVPADEALPTEPTMLGAVFTGRRNEHGWRSPEVRWDFFGVKGIVLAFLNSLHLGAPDFAPVSAMPFHPTRTAGMTWGEVTLGTMGELHPEVCDAFDVAAGTVALEMPLAPLLAAFPDRPVADPLPRYPSVLIDLAIVVDESQAAANVESVIRRAGAPQTTSVRLFDVYTGPQVPKGKKSLAFALELQVSDRTLTEQDADAVRGRILAELEQGFGARLRT
jgi:phenylalanyl-tRNA synthetase beta chain